jgi:hypothetical protein
VFGRSANLCDLKVNLVWGKRNFGLKTSNWI